MKNFRAEVARKTPITLRKAPEMIHRIVKETQNLKRTEVVEAEAEAEVVVMVPDR